MTKFFWEYRSYEKNTIKHRAVLPPISSEKGWTSLWGLELNALCRNIMRSISCKMESVILEQTQEMCSFKYVSLHKYVS